MTRDELLKNADCQFMYAHNAINDEKGIRFALIGILQVLLARELREGGEVVTPCTSADSE